MKFYIFVSALFSLVASMSAQANVIYNVSDTSVNNCTGHGLWTNNYVSTGGSCRNYFSIDAQLNVDNTNSDQSLWTAILTGTATNSDGLNASIDLLLSSFQETWNYKQEGGGSYNTAYDVTGNLPTVSNLDIDFFSAITGTISIDGTDIDITGPAGGFGFQFGYGANAKSPTDFGGSAWILNTAGSRHWDLNLNFSEPRTPPPPPPPIPEPASIALFGLGLFGIWYRHRKMVPVHQ